MKTNLEIAEFIYRYLDKRIAIKSTYNNSIKFVKDRPGHTKRYAIYYGLINKEIGCIANNNFEEGLEKTIE